MLVSLLLLPLGGCGGAAARNPDAGNISVQDAEAADVPGSPADATDVALFPPAISTDRKGAATEYVAVEVRNLAPKPATLSHREAGKIVLQVANDPA